MNWKGCVQIIPTDNQVKRFEQAIKSADEFDYYDQLQLIESCTTKQKVSHWLFWTKEVDYVCTDEVNEKAPVGLSWYVWKDCDYFYWDDDYKIMLDIQQMIETGNPLYLDNEMVKVWNKVQETLHDTQRFPK